MAELPAAERSRLPGLKPDRADITLAGAVVISTVLDRVGRRAASRSAARGCARASSTSASSPPPTRP